MIESTATEINNNYVKQAQENCTNIKTHVQCSGQLIIYKKRSLSAAGYTRRKI